RGGSSPRRPSHRAGASRTAASPCARRTGPCRRGSGASAATCRDRSGGRRSDFPRPACRAVAPHGTVERAIGVGVDRGAFKLGRIGGTRGGTPINPTVLVISYLASLAVTGPVRELEVGLDLLHGSAWCYLPCSGQSEFRQQNRER